MLMLQICLTQDCQVKLSSKGSFKGMYKQASQRRWGSSKKLYLLLFKDCIHLVTEMLKFNSKISLVRIKEGFVVSYVYYTFSFF